MDKYIFTDEEINKILLHSPMALPSSPASYGLKGSNIKSFFYDYIRQLMLLINDRFILIERDNDKSYEDIGKRIGDLISRDTELGDAIAKHYSDINLAHDDIKAKFSDDLSQHNNDTSAHKKIQFDISEIKTMAQNALNFASGKSKIIPVKDVFEMTTKLDAYLNEGDKFVLSDKNVPDFTLFEKESTNEKATEFTQTDLLFGNVEFLPGESYLYNGYLLVASESGIDTSLFAKKTDLTVFEQLLEDLGTSLGNVDTQLTKKEDKLLIKTETAESVTLNNDTEYNLGLRNSIVLNLSEQIPDDYECIVNFRSGTVATKIDSDENIVFTQDDCYQGKLYPVSNRLYEINIKNVSGVLIAKVGACDYAIL